MHCDLVGLRAREESGRQHRERPDRMLVVVKSETSGRLTAAQMNSPKRRINDMRRERIIFFGVPDTPR
jgi:hypothetical protein